MLRLRSVALVVAIGGLFGTSAAATALAGGSRYARYAHPAGHERIDVPATPRAMLRPVPAAGCPLHGSPIACRHGAGCQCVPNARWFGYFPTLWRVWPCEPRPDKALPQAAGSEVVPTPAGMEQLALPVEEVEPSVITPPGETPEPVAPDLPGAPSPPQPSLHEPASPAEPGAPIVPKEPSWLPDPMPLKVPEKPMQPGLPPIDLRAPAPFPPPSPQPSPLEKIPDPDRSRAPADNSGQRLSIPTHIVPEPEPAAVQVQLVAPTNSGWTPARRSRTSSSRPVAE